MSLAEIPPDQHGFENFEPQGSAINEYLSDIIRFPGYGELDESCEEIKPIAVCDEGHTQFGGAEPCRRRTCPVHWRQWQKRAAANMVARLGAYRAAQGDRWSPGRRMLHVMSAPPQDQRWTVSRFWEARSDSHGPVEEAGARAGAVVPHAYRTSDAGEELWQLLGGAVAQERGKHTTLRWFADDWEEMQPLVEVAPHSHMMAAARDLDGETVEEIEASTGWVVTNIRAMARFYVDANDALPTLTREDRIEARRSEDPELEALEKIARRRAMEGYEDMARLALYELEHSSVQPKVGDLPARQTVTYWGEVAPGSFDPEEELGAETWETIQGYAAAAVGLDEDPEGDGVGRQCSREDCEASVWPVTELRDRLADPDHSWWDGLPFDRQCELLGLYQWLSHKPPPGGVGGLPPGGFDRSPRRPAGVRTREDWLEWLRSMGRARYQRNELPFLAVGMDPGDQRA